MPESNANISSSGNGDLSNGKSRGVNLYFHAYSYFPYEKELARREVHQVAAVKKLSETKRSIRLPSSVDVEKLRVLTYIAEIANSKSRFSTVQHEIEESHRRVTGNGKRQATRYSAHGLHEYRGRFNPQVVGFLLNYLGASKRTIVFDPFCGSGTTLVESALHGVTAFGFDMNPLAVFLCNAKLRALDMPASEIDAALRAVLKGLKKSNAPCLMSANDTRLSYLANWFPAETLTLLENLRASIREHGGRAEAILLSLASDLLRDYSLQEPSDLRIRRRICALPSEPFLSALEIKAAAFFRNLGAAQEVTGLMELDSEAVIEDSRELAVAVQRNSLPRLYDLVITSPPYATALPYIDTQRLSLVWLGLCSPGEIKLLDADAVGSREMRDGATDWQKRLAENADDLPPSLASFCRKLQSTLSSKDGFRRQAVPRLLYRYLADMRRVFVGLPKVLKKDAKLAFVVGPNHTTLSGLRFDIDTPNALALIAKHVGFAIQEVIPLQSYQRYSLHHKNSINSESLTILGVP